MNGVNELVTTQLAPWLELNQTHLDLHIRRLRLVLHRRVLWLRTVWGHNPPENFPGLVVGESEADRLLTGMDARVEQQFYREDARAAALSTEIVELATEIAQFEQSARDRGLPPALEILVRSFELTPFERETLVLCLAPELDPTFERLFGYIQDDLTRKYATPYLALSLFGNAQASDSWASFLPDAPLRRFRLVTLEPAPLPATPMQVRPLRLDDRVVSYLLGANRLDSQLEDRLTPIPAAPVSPIHRELVERLVRTIESDLEKGGWPAVNLVGPHGAGKRSLARAVCERLGLPLYELDLTALPPLGPDREDMLRLIEREAVLIPLAVYVKAPEPSEADPSLVAFDKLVERLNVMLIVSSHERWRGHRDLLYMAVPKPDANAQRQLWSEVLAGIEHSVDGRLDEIVQQFDFGPSAVVEAVAIARGSARVRAGGAHYRISADDIWKACRERAGWQLDNLAQRIEPVATWDDIVLPDDVYLQLREIAGQVACRPQVYEHWGFGAKLNRGRGISALFAGPSGTGKTMAAEILARHLGLDLYRIDLSGVVSKYIGETEKNLRRVFDAAEQSGACLFFDECDALFGKRSEIRDSHDRYANIEINYLLQRMEDYRGLAILATNMKSLLDQAFLRRLRFLVDFPFPDVSLRSKIWQKAFPSTAPVNGLDYAFLARLDIAGGNIKNIALNAAFLAASEQSPIGMEHVMRSAKREYAKIDKLAHELEFDQFSRGGRM